jgi:pyruvate formate lyase activating enzyme
MEINEKAQKLSVSDIVKEALSCRMIFIDGGGVTLTGGEVTCQKSAVLNLLKELKENSIHTCIETNASLTDCDKIFNEVDYMIADFKSPSPNKLKSVTGADIDIIKNNLLLRAKTGKPLLIRIPLINNFNNSKEDVIEFASFFEALQNKSNNDKLFFEILTYHEYGKEKYEKLGKEYTVCNGFVTDEDIKNLANEIKKRDLKLINT